VVSSTAKTLYVFDLPFAVEAGGFYIDVPGGLDRSLDLTSGGTNFDSFLLSGFAASAYESYVWQENALMDAVSTVRGIQFANETASIGVISIPAGTSGATFDSTYKPQLKTGGTVAQLSYSDTDIASIKGFVTQGYSVTLPKSLVGYTKPGATTPAWTGIVYEADFNGGNQAAASFPIGQYAGGYAVGDPWVGSSYTSTLNNNYVSAITTPTYLNNISLNANTFVDTAPIGLLTTSNGMLSNTLLSGDPVNMVTGNLYHTETDFRMNYKGGFPVVMTRSYNSRKPELGSFGWGWTSNFNARLKFYGTESVTISGTATTVAKLSWIDGTGAERFFQTSNQTNGAITRGSPIPNPPGVFVTFQRSSDGLSYTIREKNGLTYTFSGGDGPPAAAGSSTTPTYAYLSKIVDANGNTFNVNQTQGAVSSVTDGQGNSLLTFSYCSDASPAAGCATTAKVISTVKDAKGNRTYSYKYDSSNNLIGYSNALVTSGQQTKGVVYSYYTAVDGTNLTHAMKQYTLPRGNGMKFEYYANGRVFRHSVVNLDGTVSPDKVNSFTYNDFRRETVQTNERLGEKHFFFDPFGNPKKVVEENGAEHSYTYDCTDPSATPDALSPISTCRNPYNRLSETDPLGQTTTYGYDSSGNVQLITPPSGSASATQYFDYNTFAKPRRILNANGSWTIQIYDTKGNLTNSIQTAKTYQPASCASSECGLPPAAQIVAWTVNGYDTLGDLTSTKQVRDFVAEVASHGPLTNTGPIVSYTYPANNGWPATSMSRIGIQNTDTSATTVNTASLTFDSAYRLTDSVDGDWYAKHVDFDVLDRAYNATDALGKLRAYRFDANGNAAGQSLTVTLQGNPTLVDSSSMLCDDADRVKQTVDAGGGVTAYVYDEAGNVLNVTNPDGYAVSYDYDAANRPVHAYDQQNHSVTTVRDVSGRVRTVTDANGNTTTYDYWDASKNGRLKSVTTPAVKHNGTGTNFTTGRSLQYDYDAAGNVSKVTVTAANNGSSRVTLTFYDALNRPTRIVGPSYLDASSGTQKCPVTTRAYDNLGNLHQVSAGSTPSPCSSDSSQDTLKVQLTQDYDDFGRLIRRTDALSRQWLYTYDSHNNLQTAKDPKSQITTYTWDRGHQLLSRKDQDGRTASYTRNDLGQTLTVTYPEVSYTYAYNTAHRLASVTDSRGAKKLTYGWSAGGLLNSVTDNEGHATTYLYDPVGRLTSITAPNGEAVTYQFDAGGRLVQRSLANGNTTHHVYNEDNSLRQIVNSDKAGHVFTQHDYVYDGFGNRQQLTDNINGTSITYGYAYDELNRLKQVVNGTSAQQEDYTYDARGNRLTRSVGASSPTVTAFVYDDANELKEIHAGSPTGTLLTSLSYDNNGNLQNDGTRTYTWDSLDQLKQVASGGVTVAYSYDDSGRRIKKVASGTTTQWLYDGQDVYATYTGSWTRPTMLFTSGGGVDDPVIGAVVSAVDTNAYTQANYYHADGLGSVVGLSNNANPGLVTQRFDAWGNKLNGNVDASAQYGYTGREPDETGLVYMRARYYNPVLGRFVSRDPAGLQGGLNGYAYCDNDPVNCTDPSGMIPMLNSALTSTNYFAMPSLSTGTGGLTSGTNTLSVSSLAAAPVVSAMAAPLIYGNPQVTTDPLHAQASQEFANAAIATGDAQAIYQNKALSTVTGDPAMGLQRPDTTIVWKDGSITCCEAVSPSQTSFSQQVKAANMSSKLSAAGYKVNAPVVVDSAVGATGGFKIRASGALMGLGLIDGLVNLWSATRDNPNINTIQGLYIMMGFPPPSDNMH
jgi:RHS repeat-associated protein